VQFKLKLMFCLGAGPLCPPLGYATALFDLMNRFTAQFYIRCIRSDISKLDWTETNRLLVSSVQLTYVAPYAPLNCVITNTFQ